VAVSRPPVVLVMRALGLGDLLTALPALRGVSRALPGHWRLLAAPAGLAPLARAAGVADAVLPAEGAGPFPCPMPVDVAVNLHGRGPQSHAALLAARPRRLVAFHHPDLAVTDGGPVWRAGEHEAARWCRMLTAHGIPCDPGDLALRLPRVPLDVRGATLVHPGAAAAGRRWPWRRFAAVARHERAAGRAVVVTGSPGERALARRLAAAAGLPDAAVLAGRTSLLELASAVATAGRVVCGDTGVGHLATALGTPSVVLFGPVPPAEWGPPPDPRHRPVWRGRRGDPHAETLDPGLAAITVDDVTRELGALP
jgi:ADP-heptose:LPS heptosyltransferase